MGLHRRQAAAMLLVLLTSYLAVRTSPGGAGVSEWWVASGIGACAMVISPRRHAPWLFLGVAGLTWAGNVLGGRAPDTGPWLGLGNAVESYVIAAAADAQLVAAGHACSSWRDLRRYFIVVALGSAAPAADGGRARRSACSTAASPSSRPGCSSTTSAATSC